MNKEIFENYQKYSNLFEDLAETILYRYVQIWNAFNDDNKLFGNELRFSELYVGAVQYVIVNEYGETDQELSIPFKFFTDTEQSFFDFEEELEIQLGELS